MQISVVIANKNGEKFIKNCLDSVLGEKGSFEVVVVDDGSVDRSVELLDRFERKVNSVSVIRLPRNVGAAEARNIGVANTTGKYILFLDVDTKIKPGWYKETLAFFRRNKKTGAAQVKIMRMGKNKFDSAGELMGPFGFLIERARGAKDKGQFDEENRIFSGKSAGMIIRREVFEALGGFDEDYQIFLEDTDLFWRVWLSGWEVRFCFKVVVEHAYLTKEKPMRFYIENKVFYRGARNTIMNLIKNLSKKRWWVVVVNTLCWLVLGVVFCWKGNLRRGWAMFSGVGWNGLSIFKVLRKRRRVQSKRRVSDEELFGMVGDKRKISYYLGKAKAYVTGKPF